MLDRTKLNTVCPCTFLGLWLRSSWKQAIILQLCPSSSPTICPLKVLRIRFICPQCRSVFPIPSTHSKHQGSNYFLFCDRAAETAFLWTKRTTLAPDMTPAHKHFSPHVVMGDHTSEAGHAGLNLLLCLAQAHGQHLSNSTFSPFLPLLPIAVFPAPKLPLLPQAWKKGSICCSSCRLQ